MAQSCMNSFLILLAAALAVDAVVFSVGFQLNCTRMPQREGNVSSPNQLFWVDVWLVQKGSYGKDNVLSSRTKKSLSGDSQMNFALTTEDVNEGLLDGKHELYLHINHNCGVKRNKKTRHATKIVEVGAMDPNNKLKLLGTINLP
ncbi:unnamed protein product [Cylicocyclus nassatus]|uniref:Uncharacterized protein n=1 Tax=Cylicocyclus nassatus TaxID=53992 RepID=A0AA36H4H9_CYLNA|nr:unnamed protein product [Cylicocyclus nassatus]